MNATQNLRKSYDFSIESLLRKPIEDQPSLPVTTSSDPNGAYLSLRETESNTNGSLEDPETFSWLHCTRFKPPKLPRSKKRGNFGKRVGRGPRIPFSPHQIAVLETTFSNSQYLSSDCINRLANALHLSETRVKIWFQNRRARFRREKEARDCPDLSPSGLIETKKVSTDKRKEEGPVICHHQNKSLRKRTTLMTTPGHYLALQIQSRRALSLPAGLPRFQGTYKNIDANFIKGTHFSSTPSLINDIADCPLFHHPPLLNDPMFAGLEYFRSKSDPGNGLPSLMALSEDRMSMSASAPTASLITSSTYSHQHHHRQPRIY